MRAIITACATAAAAITIAQAAVAQDYTPSFRGFRVEGNVGGDRFQSQGNHNDKFGYGGTIGFDGMIGDKIVIGPEGTVWTANHGNTNVTAVTGGTIDHKSFEEFGTAVRVGYLVTPQLLVFGKGGWVSNEQRQRYVLLGGATKNYNHTGTDGYQLGAGAEYTLPALGFSLPLYVSAQYVYSNYDDHTARQRLMGGVGIRFK